MVTTHSGKPRNPGNVLNFFQSWNVSWNLLFSEFCLGNVLEFFSIVHQYFFSHYFCIFFFSIFALYFLSLCILTTTPAIISFSLFQEISNMAKCNCTFNDGCLIEFEWVEKGPNAGTAYCKLFHHKFDISNMGRSMVTSHSKGKKHKDKEISVKSLPVSIFAKKKKKKSDVVKSLTLSDLHQGQCPSSLSSSSDVRHKKQCTLPGYLLDSGVTEAEILWAIPTVLTQLNAFL